MHLKVLKPDETIIDEDVSVVTLPTEMGEIAPLDGHDPLLTVLKPGAIAYRRAEEDGSNRFLECEIDGGVAEVTHHTVTLFVSEAKLVSQG